MFGDIVLKRKIQKIGGSYHVVIPSQIADSMNIDTDTHMGITMDGNQLIMTPQRKTHDNAV